VQKQPVQKQNERWQALELSFTSTQHYDNPYQDVELDVHFTAPDGSVLTMPGFWYGENIWKVRFAAPTVGAWRYGSVCSSPSDTGLHQQTGAFNVTEYQGELDIYKHGFLKVSETKRYLEHDDGTPFFWLGDTHWLGLSAKERLYESNDPRFSSQFKGMIQRRLEQGFTVWAGSLMLGEWNDASGSATPYFGTYVEGGHHPWLGTGYQMTASSGIHQVDFTGFSEGHVLDGFADTQWESRAETFLQWLRIDLGTEVDLSHIELHFPEHAWWAYRLEGSRDDKNYQVLTDCSSGREGQVFRDDVAGECHYVRVVIIGAARGRARLSLLRVFGTSGTCHDNSNVLRVLNPAFWQNIDERLSYLAEQGLVLMLGLDWGRNLQRSLEMVQGYQRAARYVLARYGAYPMLFYTAGEPFQSPYYEGWKEVLQTFHQLDPYKRPATFHNWKPHNQPLLPYDRAVTGLTFAYLQTGEFNLETYGLAQWQMEYDAEPRMPVIEAECGYEKGNNSDETRWSAWQSLMSGCCGYTYGAYGIWSATWDDKDTWNEFGTHVNWFDAIDFLGAEHMRIFKQFWSQLPWWTLAPSTSITWHTAPENGLEQPTQIASDDGSIVVAYLPHSSALYTGRVQLGQTHLYQARWFSPRTGDVSTLGAVKGDWTLPNKPDEHDWVLLIQQG
jgi:Protein of unknown function (DUF4038)/Domain of unknown function (DUF5060)/F5/8 type C domain/Putative collagen-binding domain of a collagenase